MSNRTPYLPSASSAARSLQCPGSVVLPRDYRGGEATLEMRKGSYLHLKLEQILSPKPVLPSRLAALAKTLPPDEVSALDDACSRITSGQLLRNGVLVGAELAFAYNPVTDTARLLGESIEREYRQHGLDPYSEVAGSADIVLSHRSNSGALLVGDFKTAHYDNQVSYSWQPQLDMLALMASRFYGVDHITTGICLVFDDGSLKWTHLQNLDAISLDAIAATIRDAYERWQLAAEAVSAGQAPETKPGPWCDHCQSKALCPSWTMLARQLASAELGLSPEAIAALTPSEAGLVWERLKTAESILDVVKEQLQKYAARVPLILPDGLRLRHQQCERDSLDDKQTLDYLTKTYGAERAAECGKYKFSKAELHRVLGDDEAKKTLAALRRNGAISKTTYSQFKPVAAKENPHA